MVEIKTMCCGVVICSGETARAAVESAVRDGESLAYADLEGMFLSGVDIPGANLSHANLRRTQFNYANLRGANISDSGVYMAEFHDADLRDTNQTGVYILMEMRQRAKTTGVWAARGVIRRG